MLMNTNEILWKNVSALMKQKYGEDNLYRTSKDSALTKYPISLGSLQRIKKGETAVGLDVLDKIAHFFEMQTWQLLIPELDPTNPPVFLTENQKEFFNKVKTSYKELIQQ